jgi:hypothetical protein
MAKFWIDFAYGKGWGKGDGKDILVIGVNEEIRVVEDKEYDLNFREGRGEMMLKIGWEKCFKLGEILQGVYEDKLTSKL